MNKPTRRLFLGLVLGAAAIGGGGCNSPTLPLPPPVDPQVARGEEGLAVVSGDQGSVEPSALVICVNNSTGAGVVTTANARGAFRTEIPARTGDLLEVWQRVGSESSSSAVLVVP